MACVGASSASSDVFQSAAGLIRSLALPKRGTSSRTSGAHDKAVPDVVTLRHGAAARCAQAGLFEGGLRFADFDGFVLANLAVLLANGLELLFIQAVKVEHAILGVLGRA
jgi:hypothetical protein